MSPPSRYQQGWLQVVQPCTPMKQVEKKEEVEEVETQTQIQGQGQGQCAMMDG